MPGMRAVILIFIIEEECKICARDNIRKEMRECFFTNISKFQLWRSSFLEYSWT
jgi:hypothetical protein